LFWQNMKLPQACKHKKAPHCCEAFGSPSWSILEPILG